jgi:hypothetical protein
MDALAPEGSVTCDQLRHRQGTQPNSYRVIYGGMLCPQPWGRQ